MINICTKGFLSKILANFILALQPCLARCRDISQDIISRDGRVLLSPHSASSIYLCRQVGTRCVPASYIYGGDLEKLLWPFLTGKFSYFVWLLHSIIPPSH